ncbi:phosphotransferase [Nocardia sp. NPDC005366]|uniref:phosphotransferase enzyme family protein n=1 Tax=Nocardia sp. NPDC005366 TaxID=3156878 RepID=UPI0033A845C0
MEVAGNSAKRFPGHDQSATLAVLHWVPGTAEPPYQQPGLAHQMGAATAHLHRNAATVEIPDFDRPTWDHETILLEGAALTDRAATVHLQDHGRRTLRAVADRFTHALAGKDPLIHCDLHRENMIALPTGGVGIIDFGDCGQRSPILDIATVLPSIHRIAHTIPGAYEKFAHDFLDGYAGIFALPADLNDLLEPYLVLRDCFVLNFVSGALSNASVAAWGTAGSPESSPQWTPTWLGSHTPAGSAEGAGASDMVPVGELQAALRTPPPPTGWRAQPNRGGADQSDRRERPISHFADENCPMKWPVAGRHLPSGAAGRSARCLCNFH